MADDARLTVVLEAKIDKLIDGLNKAETKLGSFSRAAYGAAAQARKAFDLDASRANGPLKQLELMNKIGVAQAAGNTKEAAALKEQLALLNQVSALRRLGLSQIEAQALAEKHLAAVTAAEAIAARSGRGFGGAGRAIFSKASAGAVEEGAGALGVLGPGLEALGPAAIVAAAGIIAVVESLKRAHEATEFAEKIEETAKRLHQTTDALQEYRYAVFKAGGTEEGADEALGGFSETLGKAEEGLKRSLKAFTQLGFTPAQVKSFKDTDDALQQVIERLAKVKDNAIRDALIGQFGLGGMKALIIDGVDRMRQLRAEAEKIGIVMDSGMVKRGAEANKEFTTLSKVIDVQLKSAFIDLAPILTGLLSLAAGIARQVADIVDSFRSIENKRTQAIRDNQAQLATSLRGDAAALRQHPDSEVLHRRVREQIAQVNANNAELSRRAGEEEAVPKPTGEIEPPGGRAAHTPKGDVGSVLKSAQDALDEAQQRLAEASVEDPGGTQEANQRQGLEGIYKRRADAEVAAIDAELKRQQDDLEAQKAKNEADKSLTPAIRARAKGELEAAGLADQDAAEAKKRKVIQDAFNAQEDAANQVYQAKVEAQIAELEAQQKIATTISARGSLEERILALRQNLERDLKVTELQRQRAKGEITPEQYDTQLKSLGGQQSAAALAQSNDNLGPLAQFAHDASGKDMGEELQKNAVSAIDALNSGVIELLDNSEQAKKELANLPKKFAMDVLKAFLQKGEGDLLSSLGLGGAGAQGSGGAGAFASAAKGIGGFFHMLGFFAGGTDRAPGGLSVVGERGPELVNLPRGAQVIPNSTLGAIANGKIGSAGRGTVIVAPVSNFDMRGNSSTQEVQSMIASANAQNRALVMDGVRRSLPGWQTQNSYERG